MRVPARKGFRAGTVLALLLILTLFFFPPRGHAQRGSDPRVPTVVLLASDLSWEDLRENGPLRDIRRLATMGSIAVLNTAVSGEATEAAAFLSVGAGERVAAPGKRGPTILLDEVPLTVADIAAEVYPANGLEGNAVRPVYVRRFGVAPPPDAVGLALGLPTLERTQPSPSRVSLLGALGDTLRQSGRRVAVFGDWRAALVGMDRNGAVYQGSVLTEMTPSHLPAAFQSADVVIASVRGRKSLRLLARAAAPLLQRGAMTLIVAGVSPPKDTASGKWTRLGWVIAAGPGFPPHTLLTSATTRTRGLVANVDIAPTILALQGVPPFSGSAGHALHPVSSPAPFSTVDRLDRQTVAAANATIPLLVAYGIFAIGTTLAALVFLWFGIAKAQARFGLLIISAVLLTLLPVGYLAPINVWHYGLMVLGLAVALAAAVHLLGLRLGVSPIGLLFALLATVICGDALLGSPLVSSALLSGFYLTGIRFYGLGNEYTGFLIGALLTAWGLMPRGNVALILLGIVAILLIGLPWFGADAGGALAATVTFTVAVVLSRSEGTLRPRHIAGAFAGAFVVVALLALLDRLQAPATQTHIGGAIAAGESRGFGAIWDIVLRKLAMNAGIAGNSLTLAVIAGMLPIWLLLTRGRISERLRALLAARPALRGVLIALLWGAFTSAVFNDSGVAMALMLLAPPTTAVIHEMLSE